MCCEQLKHSSRERISELKKRNMHQQQSLQSREHELKETRQLLELARRSAVHDSTHFQPEPLDNIIVVINFRKKYR